MKNWEKIFRDGFNEGDDVVIEDDQGRFIWGKIKSVKEEGLTLYQQRFHKGKNETIKLNWEEIVFIAYNDFPIKTFKDANYDQAYNLASETNEKSMRSWLLKSAVGIGIGLGLNLLGKFLNNKEEKKESTDRPPAKVNKYPRGRYRTLGFGCPYIAEDVYVNGIINSGNNYGHWGEDDEETLVLTSKDGALMYSYDMDHLFHPR